LPDGKLVKNYVTTSMPDNYKNISDSEAHCIENYTKDSFYE